MINYNYAFSEKNGSLSFNSSYKDKNLKESTADLVKDELINVIQNQEQKITNISKIGKEQSFELVINDVSPVSEISQQNEEQTANVNVVITTDPIVFYFRYGNVEYIIEKIGNHSKTNLAELLDLTDPFNTAIGTFSIDGSNIKASLDNDVARNASGIFGYIQNGNDSTISASRTQNKVEFSNESYGFTLKKGNTIISQITFKDYSSVTIDILADDIIASARTGFTITKEFVNGVDDSQGIKMFVKYTPDDTNFDSLPKDFELKFYNEKGSISIAQ